MSGQHPYADYPESEHQVRVACGDPVALAYEWISAYAKNLSGDSEYETVTVEELIDTAMTHVDTNDRWGGDYISRGGLLEGVYVDDTFWDKLAILKGIEIPESNRNNFFSCSC